MREHPRSWRTRKEAVPIEMLFSITGKREDRMTGSLSTTQWQEVGDREGKVREDLGSGAKGVLSPGFASQSPTWEQFISHLLPLNEWGGHRHQNLW